MKRSHLRRPNATTSERAGTMRAAVLSANDGIVSTTPGLVVGVAPLASTDPLVLRTPGWQSHSRRHRCRWRRTDVSGELAGRYQTRGPGQRNWNSSATGRRRPRTGRHLRQARADCYRTPGPVATQLAAMHTPDPRPRRTRHHRSPARAPGAGNARVRGIVRDWARCCRSRSCCWRRPPARLAGSPALSLACLAVLGALAAGPGASMLRGPLRVCLWSALAMGSPRPWPLVRRGGVQLKSQTLCAGTRIPFIIAGLPSHSGAGQHRGNPWSRSATAAAQNALLPRHRHRPALRARQP